MKGISCGTQKTEGKTWFLELSDKREFNYVSKTCNVCGLNKY